MDVPGAQLSLFASLFAWQAEQQGQTAPGFSPHGHGESEVLSWNKGCKDLLLLPKLCWLEGSGALTHTIPSILLPHRSARGDLWRRKQIGSFIEN